VTSFLRHGLVLLAGATGVAACTVQDAITGGTSTADAGQVVYCSPTRGPITISEGADPASLQVCPPSEVCQGPGPVPFGVTPAWVCASARDAGQERPCALVPADAGGCPVGDAGQWYPFGCAAPMEVSGVQTTCTCELPPSGLSLVAPTWICPL
jgi:hypothetical protein